MDIENNYQAIYCDEDDEYRVNCQICDLLCIERYYKNHLKSSTHMNNIFKKNSDLITNKWILLISPMNTTITLLQPIVLPMMMIII